MNFSSFTIFAALVACFGVLPIMNGFSVVSTKTRIQHQQQYTHIQSFLFPRSRTNKKQATYFRSSPSDDNADDLLPKPQTDETTSSASESSNQLASSNSSQTKQKQSRGVTKTILLTVPLFFKFLVVLVIKFMTDLIVFPLLFSYRLCRRAKRKILGLFSSTTKKKDMPNGETRP